MNAARRLIGALFLVMLTALPAAAESIQLQQLHGIYMVPVQINDAIAIPFVLDSGAAEVAITQDVFLVLLRSGTVSQSDFVGTGTYTMADGSEHSSERYVLHKMAVGSHIVTNVIANVVSVKADPLLGQSFLSKLPAWTIDNAQHALVLNDKPGPTGEQPQAQVRVPRPQPTQPAPEPIAPPPMPGLPAKDLALRGEQALDAKNYVQALYWFRMAADQGDPSAQDNIGLMYEVGWGVSKDYAQAMLWYRKAADHGFARAAAHLGGMYAGGLGVSKDCAMAKQWIERAAFYGNESVQRLLRNGVGGLCRW